MMLLNLSAMPFREGFAAAIVRKACLPRSFLSNAHTYKGTKAKVSPDHLMGVRTPSHPNDAALVTMFSEEIDSQSPAS
jgi:hypothetical protein